MPRPASPALLSLVGPSGAGKTTLATGLLAHWRGLGLRVGYLKHASHGFELDRPGKDSARAAVAGADGVVLAGPGGVAFLDPHDDLDPRRLAARFLAGRDVVLCEGFRHAALPSLVVVGASGPAAARAEVRGRLLAWVRGAGAPELPPSALPVFGTSDVGRIAGWVERRLRLPAPSAATPC